MKEYICLSEILDDIESGNTSVPKLVDHYLQKIEASNLNAFLEVFDDEALDKAKSIQAKIENKTAGKLAGMVIAIKDNMAYKDHKVSASSKILEGFVSIYSATAIQRLVDEDVIIIGRLNCDEFAMGSSNENSAFGSVSHPVDNDYVPGGSSGGSAAAVADGLCLASLGSDTGGSIRQPASFCGVIGLKPTYGRISRYGLLAYASSYDQIGTFSKSIDDCALLLQVMAGNDEYDSTVSTEEVGSYLPEYQDSETGKTKYNIAYIKEYLDFEGNDPEILSSFHAKLKKLENDGHTLTPVSFPYVSYIVPTYYILTTAEASSNLARYDGIRYGYRSKFSKDIESTYIKSRSEGFGKEVKKRIMLGTFVLSSGYYDAYYSKAQKVRSLMLKATEEIFQDNDFIILPTTPSTAFKKGAIKDPIQMYLQDIFTVHANHSGNPAISLPLDTHSNGLAYGTQIIAPHFKEKELLQFSADLINK